MRVVVGMSGGVDSSVAALLMYSAVLWLGKRLMAADNLDAVHSILHLQGPIMLLVIFLGLAASMALQRAGRGKKGKEKDKKF